MAAVVSYQDFVTPDSAMVCKVWCQQPGHCAVARLAQPCAWPFRLSLCLLVHSSAVSAV